MDPLRSKVITYSIRVFPAFVNHAFCRQTPVGVILPSPFCDIGIEFVNLANMAANADFC